MEVDTAANIGMWSSAAASFFAVLFALSMAAELLYWAYFVCLLLPVAYILLCLAHSRTLTNTRLQIFADAAVVFATMYAICISIVYYVQLTFVRLGNPSPVILSVVEYYPPSAFFAINALGYSFLGISTIFVGFALEGNKLLKAALFFHGLQCLVGLIICSTPFVYTEESRDKVGEYSIPLYAWCLVFAPTCVLLSLHFRRLNCSSNTMSSTSAAKTKKLE